MINVVGINAVGIDVVIISISTTINNRNLHHRPLHMTKMGTTVSKAEPRVLRARVCAQRTVTGATRAHGGWKNPCGRGKRGSAGITRAGGRCLCRAAPGGALSRAVPAAPTGWW